MQRGKIRRRQNAAKNRLAPVEGSDIAGTDFCRRWNETGKQKSGSLPCNG